MRALLGGHGGVRSRKIGSYLVAIAEVVSYDGVHLLKREGLVIHHDLFWRLSLLVSFDDVFQADAVAAQADDIGRLELQIVVELHAVCHSLTFM
jgi:hypothetical protein